MPPVRRPGALQQNNQLMKERFEGLSACWEKQRGENQELRAKVDVKGGGDQVRGTLLLLLLLLLHVQHNIHRKLWILSLTPRGGLLGAEVGQSGGGDRCTVCPAAPSAGREKRPGGHEL